MPFKISVVMPVRNAAEKLPGALQSVIEQEWDDTEIIVVDGASTDATQEVVAQYSNEIAVFISEPDSGWADAFNKGISAATGEYVVMLAADDRFTDTAFTRFAKSLKIGTEIWAGAIIVKTCKGFSLMKSDPNLEELRYSCSLRNPASFYRRDVFEKYGYLSTSYTCSNDREYFLRCYTNGCTFQISDEPITVFAQGGMSTRNPRLAYREGRVIALEYGSPRLEVEKRHIMLCIKSYLKDLAIRFAPTASAKIQEGLNESRLHMADIAINDTHSAFVDELRKNN